MTTSTVHRNGIDVRRLEQTIAAIDAKPDLAKFTFRAHSSWLGGARTRTKIQAFYGAGTEDESRVEPHVLEGDEPPVLLGTDEAPNAVEGVLHALASCLAVGFVYNAAAKGIEVDELDFDIHGDLDLRPFLGLSDEERPGYQGIEVRYRVQADATRQQIEDLCAYAQRTSPVLDILRNPVPVRVKLES
jgi:uncharacterized OsmC-like protein